MTMHKVSELEGALLDAAVAKAEGQEPSMIYGQCSVARPDGYAGSRRWHSYSPSTNWTDGGPIMEREGVAPFSYRVDGVRFWAANMEGACPAGTHSTRSMLVAGMRAYVASKFGDEVDL